MKKKIVISSCLECPNVTTCKPWKALTPKQRFTLKVSTSIKEFILKGCPLEDDTPTKQQTTNLKTLKNN